MATNNQRRHLWDVELSNQDTTFQFLTPTRNVGKAVIKAENFFAKQGCIDKIRSVKYSGTIDGSI